MKQTPLKVLSIEVSVSLNSGIGIEVLNVGKSFASCEAGVKCNVNLRPSVCSYLSVDGKQKCSAADQISRGIY